MIKKLDNTKHGSNLAETKMEASMNNEKMTNEQLPDSGEELIYQKPVLTVFADLRTITLAESQAIENESGFGIGGSDTIVDPASNPFESRHSRGSGDDGGRSNRN